MFFCGNHKEKNSPTENRVEKNTDWNEHSKKETTHIKLWTTIKILMAIVLWLSEIEQNWIWNKKRGKFVILKIKSDCEVNEKEERERIHSDMWLRNYCPRMKKIKIDRKTL